MRCLRLFPGQCDIKAGKKPEQLGLTFSDSDFFRAGVSLFLEVKGRCHPYGFRKPQGIVRKRLDLDKTRSPERGGQQFIRQRTLFWENVHLPALDGPPCC